MCRPGTRTDKVSGLSEPIGCWKVLLPSCSPALLSSSVRTIWVCVCAYDSHTITVNYVCFLLTDYCLCYYLQLAGASTPVPARCYPNAPQSNLPNDQGFHGNPTSLPNTNLIWRLPTCSCTRYVSVGGWVGDVSVKVFTVMHSNADPPPSSSLPGVCAVHQQWPFCRHHQGGYCWVKIPHYVP